MNKLKSLLKKIPVLGYLFSILYYIFQLPKYIKKIQQMEKQKNHNSEELDNFYIEFENRFRGTRAEIKNRQSYYLPIIKNVITHKDDLLLDIACGRGEFLELLKDNGIDSKGIDLNNKMIQESLKYNLDVTYAEALAYLKSQKEETFKVITSFHFVEHISFEQLLELFEYSYKVLKKGGVIIFETPNPENIHVGSCSFYTDPTHKNPIPPTLLQFVAEFKKFNNVQIHKLTPLKEPKLLNIDDAEDINTLLKYANQEQDYAIIAYKI
ncbi:class I SAM-dependent methyltransferase [Campylobacterota bacterium DY0563]